MFTAYTYLADMLERLAGFNGQWVGWSMMAFGATGLIGNWAGGRLADRSALGATLLFSALMAAGLPVLGPVMRTPGLPSVALGNRGIQQYRLFIVCHVRVKQSVTEPPVSSAALTTSAAHTPLRIN